MAGSDFTERLEPRVSANTFTCTVLRTCTQCLSRDPSEYQLLIWLAETFTRAEAEELVAWVRDRHPELGRLVWYDVDAERWPSSPLPASRVDRGCQLLDFLRDPTFPLETRVMAVVLEGAEAAALNGRIVPKLRQAPPHNCDASKTLRTRHDGDVAAF